MERRLHYTVAGLLLAGGLFALPLAQHSIAGTVALVVCAAIGSYSVLPLYWTIAVAYFHGKCAAGGIAFVSMVGATGGFFSPIIIGWLKVQTGSLYRGMFVMSIIALIGIVLIWACLPLAKLKMAQ